MARLTLRLPDDLHEALDRWATVDRRSLNAQIVHVLEVARTERDAARVDEADGETP